MQEIDKVVELDLGYRPEAAVSGPLLLQTDYSTFLTFNAMEKRSDGLYHDAGTAVLEFPRCECTIFGYPNDEALPGHPLYPKGLHAYGIFEVLNSSWIRRLDEQNRVAFPNSHESSGRHFILVFHESVFECIAHDMKFEVSTELFPVIFDRLAQRVLAE